MEAVVKGNEAPQRAVTARNRIVRTTHPRELPPSAPLRRAEPQAQRIAALDGLRATAILIVLLGHAARATAAPAFLWPLRDLGISGVYLFFTISGFIITLLMLRERQRRGRLSLRAFWQRRALRILPPFAAACIGIAAASACGLMAWHWQSFLGALSFTKNTSLFGGDWFFGHFWSLSMEEQFYLFWPLLFMPLLRGGRIAAVLLALSLASPLLALFSLKVIPPKLDNTLPCIPYLAAGCLLAVLAQSPRHAFDHLRARRRLRRILLLALPAAALLAAAFKRDDAGSALTVTLAASLQPLAAFVLVAETVGEDGLLRDLLSFAPLRWLGLASYSIYLWQQIFLAPPDAYQSHWAICAWPWNIVAAIACGALAWLLVEKPLAALKKRLTGMENRESRIVKAASTIPDSPIPIPARTANAVRR